MTDCHPVQSVVGGRYQLVRLLGVGGDAEVFLAHDLDLDVEVVLKCSSGDPERLLALRSEAQLLRRIEPHRNVPLLRHTFVDHGRYIVVSDYVAGRDLGSVLLSRGCPGLAVSVVLGVLDQLAAALDHLHSHRPAVIHGDVKPENLMLADDGRLVLVDFGTALREGDCGHRRGTPGYMAMEVAGGDSPTVAADVYSMAAVAAVLLTGIQPTMAVRMWEGFETAGTRGLDRVLRRAMSFDPRRRPTTASELVSDMRTVVNELPADLVRVNETTWIKERRSLPRSLALDASQRRTSADRLREIEDSELCPSGHRHPNLEVAR